MKRGALVFALLLVVGPLSAQLTLKPAPDARAPVVGDLNGDGLADVIDDYTVQLNSGGALAAPVRLPITGRVLGVLDANGDGAIDLLATGQAGYPTPPEGPYSLWLNDGHGNFRQFAAPTNTLPSAQGDVHVAPMVADFDGDGMDDFIVPYPHLYPDWQTEDFAFYRSRGDGTFKQTDFVTVHLGGELLLSAGGRQRMAAGDVTGDGKTDVILKTEGTLLVLAGRGDGKFEPLSEHFTSNAYGRGYGMQVADIDGDGRKDLVWTNGDPGLVTVFFGDGKGGFPRMATGQAGPVEEGSSEPTGQTLALIHFSSRQRYDIALGAPHSNVAIMTYANGTLHEAALIKLFDPVPNEGPGVWYRGMNVFAGKFRADSPADLYAFNSWDQPMQKAAFLLFQDEPAEKIVPSRRRAAGGPGGSAANAAVGALTLHIVPGYVDLITGRCYGVEDTFELQRDGIFAAGTAKSGARVDAMIESNDVIRLGSLTGSINGSALTRVGEGHYKGTASWKTTCGSPFTIELDGYVQ